MFVDFEYDGILLSGFGFIVCEFSSSGGVDTISNGSNIKFTTVPILNGNKFLAAAAQYTECLSATFNICKSPCLSDDTQIEPITVDEITRLSRWLCRKEYKKFKIFKEGYEQIYFEGSFTINRVMLNDKVIGLELQFTSNRPFAQYEPIIKTLRFTTAGQSFIFRDLSDEIGYINVDATITCNASGDLTIHNSAENRTTVINHCINGEIITMKYPIISSSISTHKIQDDFNYTFFRIANSWDNSVNKITASLPCTIKFSYSPIRKVGV